MWAACRTYFSRRAASCRAVGTATAQSARLYFCPGKRRTPVHRLRYTRALELAEIPRVVEDYRRAAALVMEAGFDGVEIHGANGYFIDQFLRSTTNLRNDKYGGTPENRIRFLCEVVQSARGEVGMERTGLRLSPHAKL